MSTLLFKQVISDDGWNIKKKKKISRLTWTLYVRSQGTLDTLSVILPPGGGEKVLSLSFSTSVL